MMLMPPITFPRDLHAYRKITKAEKLQRTALAHDNEVDLNYDGVIRRWRFDEGDQCKICFRWSPWESMEVGDLMKEINRR